MLSPFFIIGPVSLNFSLVFLFFLFLFWFYVVSATFTSLHVSVYFFLLYSLFLHYFVLHEGEYDSFEFNCNKTRILRVDSFSIPPSQRYCCCSFAFLLFVYSLIFHAFFHASQTIIIIIIIILTSKQRPSFSTPLNIPPFHFPFS